MLNMTRPFKHPKTGTYWVRKVVPAALCPLVGKRELTATLGTKDVREAKAKAGPVIARFEALIASARAAPAGERPVPTSREIASPAGEWYRRRVGAYADNQKLEDLYIDIGIGLLRKIGDTQPPEEWLTNEYAAGVLQSHCFPNGKTPACKAAEIRHLGWAVSGGISV